jgi:hypothetical protein
MPRTRSEWSTTWAFVVMPDHLHWLVALGEVDLSRLVLRVKSRSAIADQSPAWPKRAPVAEGVSTIMRCARRRICGDGAVCGG